LVARILAQIFKEKPELFLDLKTCKTCQVKKDISLEGVSVDFDLLSGGVKRFNEKLGEMERIVARKSGTENKFRVMAESENEEIAKKILDAFEEEILREAVRGSN
jgi:phosphomannomutase